jgi:hypothetical protein
MSAPVLGIDPGLSGAWAALWPDGTLNVGDLPTVGKAIDGAAFARLVRSLQPRFAVVEQVGAMPKQGLASTWKFAESVGTVLGVIAACEVPLHRVTPGVWKRRFALDADKEKCRARAIALWPACPSLARKMDHGRAEAALMAKFAQESLA